MADRRAQTVTGGRRWVQRAVGLAQRVTYVLYVGVALLGVVVTPPMVLLIAAPVLGLIAAGVLVCLCLYCQQRPPGRRTVMITAALAAALVPFSEGVELLQGLGTNIGLTVLVLATIVGNYRVHELDVRPAADADSAGGSTSYAELLRVMPLETVFDEWRALERCVGVPPGQQGTAHVAGVRALLLDEMQRRDPVGFGRWLADGAVDDPEQHMPGDPGLAA